MHILVTNDDGPPSPQASPYVHCLVRHLRSAGHIVSVCLPHSQRSWIGKAHMIGQTVKPLYYQPSAKVHGEGSEGTAHRQPSTSGDGEEWILVDGTPASCVQIGLHHFFKDKGPIDLVLSGPNYGRNTTAVFALSSGTLGAALEAAVCRKKAIALSFAFFSRNHDPAIIEAACRHSVRVVEALYKQWPTDGSSDLYSINVPLVEGLEKNKTVWTEMLQNYWREGSCFQETEDDVGDAEDEEERIRFGLCGEAEADTKSSQSVSAGHKHRHFKWAPRFADVYKSVEESGPGSDGWTVRQGETSVTPLKASFAAGACANMHEELKLPDVEYANGASGEGSNELARDSQPLTIIIRYEDSYVQPLMLRAAQSVFSREQMNVITKVPASDDVLELSRLLSGPDEHVAQITPYEKIDFEYAASHRRSCLVNSYMIRKALIRKHYLSATVEHWIAKNPRSVLLSHNKRSEAFEVDYAEFLDDALVEAFDLRESLQRNASMSRVPSTGSSGREWWILKPGMSDRGQGIRLFSTMEELQAIFDGWEEERGGSDDECGEDGDDDGARSTGGKEGSDYITASHLRHFVAQPYIHPPLLVGGDARKFHVRTYVLCAGSLSVYVYKDMLALFAAKTYTPPWETTPGDVESFLTNTCLQGSSSSNGVRRFWDLELSQQVLDDIFRQISAVTGELFEAAARVMPIHFQVLPNAFEVFGLDFLVDAAGTAWLLEVNAFPDFKQTGLNLGRIVERFWEGVLRKAVAPFFGIEVEGGDSYDDLVLVKELHLR